MIPNSCSQALARREAPGRRGGVGQGWGVVNSTEGQSGKGKKKEKQETKKEQKGVKRKTR